ncbi:MAG: methyltransferase domain-containing protein [Jatrophihabitans sp.]|nr:MAG: methyltransferase domain-containing protein [Jatrophihabitans sp.]
MTRANAYVLETSDAELDRLLRAADLLAPIAISAFRQAGLSVGSKAVDLGCGPLGALSALRRVVGDSGTVVGVDTSVAALATARQALDRLGVDDVELVAADINTLEPAQLGGDDFDLAHLRLVLMHQADPVGTLSRIARLLRPGGHLVALDFFAPPHLEPGLDAVDLAWDWVIGAMRARGASPDASRRYRELCDAAGFEVLSERGTFLPMPRPVIVDETILLLSGARRGVEAGGLATAEEIDDLLAELRAHQAGSGRAWSPQTIELIARKREPGTAGKPQVLATRPSG